MKDPRIDQGQGQPNQNQINNINFALLILAAIGLALLFNAIINNDSAEELSYSQFISEIESGEIKGSPVNPVILTGNKVEGPYYFDSINNRETRFWVIIPKGSEETIANILNEKGITVKVSDDTQGSLLLLLSSWLPMIIFLGFFIFIMRQIKAGGNKVMSFGKSRAKLFQNKDKKVTFKDVAGVDEAKEELQEIIEFLMEPQKFQKLGGRIPKGVLLMGPPGTGKTLLARAIAGEASVPFFSISGSDFVEMFVGVGASRVRDLFEQGKKNAPCIIFIDEIDAVGRHRGAGLGGGHDEREQTLNQLLVEMDGFESNEGVILIAATNRPDVLDPALLRPGRIDREVVISMPDIRGREGILKIHLRNIPVEKSVDISIIARGTPGLSGAQLANLVNEAALHAAGFNRENVTTEDFEAAKDKILMGKERKSMVMSDKEKRNTAYHEAGHTLVAFMIPDADPLHKVTIIPRGRALGVTMQLPEEDKYSYTKKYMEDSIAILLGGRAAEEIFLGSFTTGAANDLERITNKARDMVCKYGMSEMGPLTFGKTKEQIFLGREISQRRDYSEATAIKIDEEVEKIVLQAYERAKEKIKNNKETLIRLAEALLEYETLDSEQIKAVIKGEKIKIEKSESLEPKTDKSKEVRCKT